MNGRFKSVVFCVSLCAVLASVSCGKGLHQDPLEGEPEEVRRRFPPSHKRVGTEAYSAIDELLQIDNTDNYTFKEGESSVIKLEGRVLTPVNGHAAAPGVDFEFALDNLQDFPGAIFDRASGTFAWTPPKHFVQDELTRYAHLDVRLITRGEPRLERKKTLSLTIARAVVDPEVLEVEDLSATPTREGEVRKFRVLVSDPDAQDVDDRRPRLLVVANKRGGKSGAHLVTVLEPSANAKNPEPLPGDQTKWVFILELDVRGREVTKSSDKVGFALIAVSRFGRSSAPKSVGALIWSSVQEPVLTWDEPIPVFAGQENVFTFSVFDPLDEGRISASVFRCDLLPGSAACSCKEQKGGSAQLCTVRWKVAPDARLGEYVLEGEVLNQSRVSGDPDFQKKSFRRTVMILAAPNPPTGPTVTPAASPTPSSQSGPEPSSLTNASPTPGPSAMPGPSATAAPAAQVKP
jgi:hypothetical protein